MYTLLLIIIAFFVFPYNTNYGWTILVLALLLQLYASFVGNREESALERQRAKYAKRLEKFYKKNKPRIVLNNSNVILKFVINGKKHLFYCVDKTNNNDFVFGGDSQNAKNMVGTMWGFIDMSFKNYTDYQDIIKLFEKIYPNNYNTYNYFYENTLHNINNFKNKNYKLKIKKDNSDRQFLICYEIASKSKKKRQKTGRKYIIQAEQSIITEIFFDCRYGSFKDFYDSYKFFSKRNDCKIKFYDTVSEKFDKQNKKSTSNIENIDINKIIETEFAKLPGINAILAKRIIKQRENISGFKTKEEFYDFCKLKPHFIEQLDKLITVGEYDAIDIIFREDELTIDLIEDYNVDVVDDNYDDGSEIIVDL